MENRTQTQITPQETMGDGITRPIVTFQNGAEFFLDTDVDILAFAFEDHFGEEVTLVSRDGEISKFELDLNETKTYVISTNGKVETFDSDEEAYVNVYEKHLDEPILVIEKNGYINRTDEVDRYFVLGKGPGLSYEELFDENSESIDDNNDNVDAIDDDICDTNDFYYPDDYYDDYID